MSNKSIVCSSRSSSCCMLLLCTLLLLPAMPDAAAAATRRARIAATNSNNSNELLIEAAAAAAEGKLKTTADSKYGESYIGIGMKWALLAPYPLPPRQLKLVPAASFQSLHKLPNCIWSRFVSCCCQRVHFCLPLYLISLLLLLPRPGLSPKQSLFAVKKGRPWGQQNCFTLEQKT